MKHRRKRADPVFELATAEPIRGFAGTAFLKVDGEMLPLRSACRHHADGQVRVRFEGISCAEF
jgi:hypothetical protein